MDLRLVLNEKFDIFRANMKLSPMSVFHMLMLFGVLFYKSERNGAILGYEGHEYVATTYTKTGRSWRCRQYRKFRCRASATTIGDEVDTSKSVEHSHPGSQAQVEANYRKSKILEEAKSNVGASNRNITGRHMLDADQDVLALMPKRSGIERSMNRAKKDKNIPVNPKDTSFDIPEELEHLILHDSGKADPNRIIVLGHNDLLPSLEQDLLFGDGTFDCVPSIFYQLYAVHAQVGNNFPPCMYFLLPNKTRVTYDKMIEILQELVPGCNPKRWLLDFEKAVLDAVQAGFPNVDISGCFFHFNQSILRWISSDSVTTVTVMFPFL